MGVSLFFEIEFSFGENKSFDVLEVFVSSVLLVIYLDFPPPHYHYLFSFSHSLSLSISIKELNISSSSQGPIVTVGTSIQAFFPRVHDFLALRKAESGVSVVSKKD